MVSKKDSNKARLQRHKRVRAKINGTADRPRLDVFRSAKNIYAQVIDDVAGVTLVSPRLLRRTSPSTAATRKQPRRLASSLLSAARLRALRLSCLTAAAMCSTAA